MATVPKNIYVSETYAYERKIFSIYGENIIHKVF